jgi:hypothetical protein
MSVIQTRKSLNYGEMGVPARRARGGSFRLDVINLPSEKKASDEANHALGWR